MKYKKGKKRNLVERDFELGAVILLCSIFLAVGGFVSKNKNPKTVAENSENVPDISSVVKLNGQIFNPVSVYQPPSEKPSGVTKLQAALDDAAKESGEKVGVYVKDLITGETASYNASSTMNATGMDGLFIYDIIQQKIKSGALKSDQIIDASRNLSLVSCANKMLSDYADACTTNLKELVKDDLYYNKLSVIGYQNSFFGKTEDKRTNAIDLAKSMDKIASKWTEKNGYQPVQDDPMHKLLKSSDQSIVLAKLPLGVQAFYFESKFGGYLNSVAVIYTDSGPVLVSMVSGEWPRPNEQTAKLSEIYKKIYDFY